MLLSCFFIQFEFIFSEELAQRLQDEENRAAHQAQEQNERVRGNQSLVPSNNPVQPTASSSSRQVERHESQRNKNVSDECNSVWCVIIKKIIEIVENDIHVCLCIESPFSVYNIVRPSDDIESKTPLTDLQLQAPYFPYRSK